MAVDWVPAWKPWDLDKCAVYGCGRHRADYRRWCVGHVRIREIEITRANGGELVEWKPGKISSPE